MSGFTLPERVFIYGKPVDMRKSFDGLFTLVSTVLGEDPLSGALFIFVNRRRNYLKGLLWDRTGFLLIAKRLEKGQFHLRNKADKVVIERNLLRRLLDGVSDEDVAPAAWGGVAISGSKNSSDGRFCSSPKDEARRDSPAASP